MKELAEKAAAEKAKVAASVKEAEAETRKLAEEKAKADKARQNAETAKKEAEKAKTEAEARTKAEKEKLEEEKARAAEARRLAAEEKAAEEKRKAAEKAKAEERRLAEERELAEMAKHPQPNLPQPTSMSGRLISLRQNATRSASHALCRQVNGQLVAVCFLQSPRMNLQVWENRDVTVIGKARQVEGWTVPIVIVENVLRQQ